MQAIGAIDIVHGEHAFLNKIDRTIPEGFEVGHDVDVFNLDRAETAELTVQFSPGTMGLVRRQCFAVVFCFRI